MSLSPVRKSLTGEHFEELVGFAKKFENEKDDLLSDLSNLVDELDEKYNPLLEERVDKLHAMEVDFENQKNHQKEELERISSKIQTLKDTQTTLSHLFEEKKEQTTHIEQTKTSIEINVSDIVLSRKFNVTRLTNIMNL